MFIITRSFVLITAIEYYSYYYLDYDFITRNGTKCAHALAARNIDEANLHQLRNDCRNYSRQYTDAKSTRVQIEPIYSSSSYSTFRRSTKTKSPLISPNRYVTPYVRRETIVSFESMPGSLLSPRIVQVIFTSRRKKRSRVEVC